MSKGKQYYGGFFWVAVASFIIPLFVGWKAFDQLRPSSQPTVQLDASGVDHNVWDFLLKNFVPDGLVDYDGMKRHYLFHDYIRQLGNCDIDALSTREEKLALYCNAYNAFVIDGVISHKISDTVQGFSIDDVDFFDLQEHILAGETVSLNDIEHGTVRPQFDEPRIHVALVCAAKSCPSIRAEAYRGDRILKQLEDQSRLFANDSTYVSVEKGVSDSVELAEAVADDQLGQLTVDLDLDDNQVNALKSAHLDYSREMARLNKQLNEAISEQLNGEQVAKYYPKEDKLVLSRILKWYGNDWSGKFPDGYLGWLEGLSEDEDVKLAIAQARQKKIGVTFAPYDWTLNSQKKIEPIAKAKGGGFGSGSSPDE